ncbi:unnamed protein product [Prorocentrum cordatum]|uniref:Uncharacterized protein n=1 Tax=Prorocentrum cordatum TaxID=2364126 RepID=A0ABN9UNW1_9DINO|nr:unnamed protein product [Polarella glacialis]
MLQNPCRSGAPHNVPTEAEVLVEQPRLPDRAAGGDRAGRSRTATKRPDLLDGAGGAHQRVAGEPPLDEVSLAVRHAAQARVAAAAATAAAAGSRVAARGAVEVAASASAAAAGGGGESPCGQVLQQLGLATLVGALCVGGLLLWHRARTEQGASRGGAGHGGRVPAGGGVLGLCGLPAGAAGRAASPRRRLCPGHRLERGDAQPWQAAQRLNLGQASDSRRLFSLDGARQLLPLVKGGTPGKKCGLTRLRKWQETCRAMLLIRPRSFRAQECTPVHRRRAVSCASRNGSRRRSQPARG